MNSKPARRLRCAVYTRVSTENGLDQEFNSLDAQHDAAVAYIRSQAHEGWSLVRTRYDDGGYSGGSTERPALQRLLADVRARQLDVIVVYKVDRLTRSLADFAKLVELFDATDSQLVILSTAAQRDDRAVEVPSHLKGGAARKIVGKLLSAGLVEEIPARGTLPVWRKDETEGALALRLTQHGLDAIGIGETTPAARGAEPQSALAAAPGKAKPARQKQRTKSSTKIPAGYRAGRSKQDRVLAMLHRPAGTTIPAIMKATGWQQHSVRGFFAGVVRKKLRITLVSDKTPRGRIYRIPSGKGAKRTRKARGRA